MIYFQVAVAVDLLGPSGKKSREWPNFNRPGLVFPNYHESFFGIFFGLPKKILKLHDVIPRAVPLKSWLWRLRGSTLSCSTGRSPKLPPGTELDQYPTSNKSKKNRPQSPTPNFSSILCTNHHVKPMMGKPSKFLLVKGSFDLFPTNPCGKFFCRLPKKNWPTLTSSLSTRSTTCSPFLYLKGS